MRVTQGTSSLQTSGQVNTRLVLQRSCSPEHCCMLVLPTPCVVLPAGQRLQRSAALLLSGAKLGRKVPLGQRTRSVEPAAGARQPGGTTACTAAGRRQAGSGKCQPASTSRPAAELVLAAGGCSFLSLLGKQLTACARQCMPPVHQQRQVCGSGIHQLLSKPGHA